MTAFLPGQDPDLMRRARQLDAARSDYQSNYSDVSPLALVDRVPLRDEFAFEWVESVGKRVLNGLANTAGIEFDEFLREHNILSRHRLSLFGLGSCESLSDQSPLPLAVANA